MLPSRGWHATALLLATTLSACCSVGDRDLASLTGQADIVANPNLHIAGDEGAQCLRIPGLTAELNGRLLEGDEGGADSASCRCFPPIFSVGTRHERAHFVLRDASATWEMVVLDYGEVPRLEIPAETPLKPGMLVEATFSPASMTLHRFTIELPCGSAEIDGERCFCDVDRPPGATEPECAIFDSARDPVEIDGTTVRFRLRDFKLLRQPRITGRASIQADFQVEKCVGPRACILPRVNVEGYTLPIAE